MDLANLLKTFHVRFSLSRPKSHRIRLKVSKLKITNVQSSIDPEKYYMFHNGLNFVLFTFKHETTTPTTE